MRKVFHRVAGVGDIAPGGSLRVSVGDDGDCVVVRTRDGRFYAVGRLCPHENEPLDNAHVEGREIVCRKHHLRFDIATGGCTNAGGYSVRTYDLRVDGEAVLVGRWEDDAT